MVGVEGLQDEAAIGDAINEAIAQRDWASLRAAGARMRDQVPQWEGGYRFGVIAAQGLGDDVEAERLLAEATARFPEIPVFAISFAMAAKTRGDRGEAASRWDAVRLRFPDHPPAYLGLIDCLREAGEIGRARALLAETVARFPSHSAVAALEASFALQFVLEAEDKAEQGRRWAALPPRARTLSGFYQLTAIVLHNHDRERDGALAEACVDALMTQPIGPADRHSPVIITETLKWRWIDPAQAAAIHRHVVARMAANPDWTPTEELYALCFDLELPPAVRSRLTAKWLLDDSHQRFSHVFGSPKHGMSKQTADLVPGFVELLLELGAVSALTPERMYRIATILYCTSPEVFDRFIAAALLGQPDDLPPTDVLGVFARIRRARLALVPTPPAPAAKPAPRRLKIALCVSGQLRGYQGAFPTWAKLGLDAHDVDTYVHTWSIIGRRFPEPLQAHRVLGGHLLEAYRKACFAVGVDVVAERYPSFSDFFDGEDTVTEAELRRFYGTDAVVVEDDRGNPHRAIHNVVKMHYKIEHCVSLAARSGKPYDLYIRIRPDLLVEGEGAIDWAGIHHRSVSEGMVFADFGPCVSGGVTVWRFEDEVIPLMVGDLFAVGAPRAMIRYASCYSKNREVITQSHHGVPSDYVPHTTLAFLLMLQGVHVAGIEGVRLDSVREPEPVGTEVIYRLLRRDIGDTPRDETDALLLRACEADLGLSPADA